MTGNITIDFEKKAHIAAAIVAVVIPLGGAIFWAHTVYIELHDNRVATERTVQLLEPIVQDLVKITSDHEKRISINSFQIEELRKRGE